MRRIKMVILIIILTFLFLGCNTNTSTNIIGIKEKETNEFINLPFEEFTFNYIAGSSIYGPTSIQYPIQVNFPNENISYEIKSKFSTAYTLDYVEGDPGDTIYNKTIYKYNGNEEETINFNISTICEFLHQYYGDLYIDIIIKEKDKIVGYTLIKIEYELYDFTMFHGKIIKQVYFPDVIEKDIVILEESIDYLLNKQRDPIKVSDIKEIETDRFFYVAEYFNQGGLAPERLHVKDDNIDRTYTIYTNNKSLSQDFNISEIEFHSLSEISYINIINIQRALLKDINMICNIIIKEKNEIIGYAVIKIYYKEFILNEWPYSDGIFIDILGQYEFPVYEFKGKQLKQNITDELVREMIKSKKFE